MSKRSLVGLLTVSCVLAIASTGAAQRKWSREQLLSAARQIMETSRYCALITTDAQGRTTARTMDAFAPDKQMVVWLATNPRSRKVGVIRKNPRVSLYYFDRENQAYVALYGIARLVNDANEKRRYWKDEWREFYPDRARDYLLIQIRPMRLEVVNTKAGIVSGDRNWRPPTVRFGSR